MKIGIAQINTTVGDLAGNREKIISAYRKLVSDGADIVVFPELVISGYPPRDLLLRKRFVEACEESLMVCVRETGFVPAVIGFPERNKDADGRSCYNSAAVCQQGRILGVARKCLLPTYDVFDESRYFQPASEPVQIKVAGHRVGISICEDIWANVPTGGRLIYTGRNPIRHMARQGCDLMVNLSASPWHFNKSNHREEVVREAARTLRVPVVYCNAVGANDELIFDGRSMLADPRGEIVAGLPAFRETLRIVDSKTSLLRPEIDPEFKETGVRDLFEALVLGLRDYVQKSGFKSALVSLSGGIDSALVAVIAVHALGAENVCGVSLPSAISSDHSKEDAQILAKNLGIKFSTISVAQSVATVEESLGAVFLGTKRDVTEENLQARVRGVMMMALSNKTGALLLATGNKSEMAVGYCTLYGDMCGGLSVISDVYKTDVYKLSKWINAEAARIRKTPPIPQRSIEKAPSAELRPGQVDQDSLPPYDLLDALLKGYIEDGLSRLELVNSGFQEAVVNDICRRVDLNEYKRKQAAPGLKMTPLAFGVGRRIPIVQKFIN